MLVLRVAVSLEQNWNAVPGGTAVSTNRLIEALVANGTVRVSGFHGAHQGKPSLRLPAGIESVRLTMPGRLVQQLWSRTRLPSIDKIVPGDIIHAPAYVLPPTKRPIVATIHDLAFLRHPEWFTPHGVRFLNRFVESALHRADAIIVPSETTAHDCLEAGFAKDRLHVIPWGTSLTRPETRSIEAAQRRHNVTAGGVIFVGTQEPRKNLSVLAEAMAQLPNIPFTVVGPTGWGENDLGNARCTGYVDDAEVAALIAGADVLAYPSHFEGFGLPVLEAMAVGTPAIVTAGTACHELGGDACLAVDTSTSGQIRKALGTLLDDHARREELSQLGMHRAEDFRWERTADRTIGVYQSVCS